MTRPTSSTSSLDPTGELPNQLAAKEASVSLGDQDAVNLATAQAYPAGAEVPTARNVRRYPELFDQAVIDSFNVDDPNTPDVDANYANYDDTGTSDASAHVSS